MPSSTPAPDRRINHRYRVLRELGRGGMGRVLLVEDTREQHLEGLKQPDSLPLP